MKNLEIGLLAAIITLAWKFIEAEVSYREGTFSLKQLLVHSRVPVNFHGRYRWQHLPMSFLNNWSASWGDTFIFPIINALVVPILCSIPDWEGIYLVCFIAGIIVSVVFHRAWWGHDENLGHVFIGWNIGISASDRRDSPPGHNNLYDDMTQAGWVHFWFMAAQGAILLMYVFTPVPQAVIFWISGLFSFFVMVQQVQAVLIQQGFWPKHLFIAVAEVTIIWAVALIKLLP